MSQIYNIIKEVVFTVGIPIIIGVFIYIGRKLQILDTLERDIGNIKEKIEGHSCDIAGMKVKVYGSPGSPMKPTEAGEKLLEESGFNCAYPIFKEKIFKILDSLNTRTLYDAEKNSITALQELSEDEGFDKMKNYAVNHPDESLKLIFRVASWNIRDDYAKEKNIKN